MTQIETTAGEEGETVTTRRRWIWGAVVGAVALAVSGGAIAATAGSSGVVRQSNGAVAIDLSRLRLVHDGKIVAGADAKKFHIFANNRELACQGITLAFDTDAEADVYLAQYKIRLERRQAAAATEGEDPNPCASVADAPRFLDFAAR